MEKQKLLKSLKRRLGLITAILAMLAVSQGMSAETIYYSPTSDWVDSGTVKYNGNNGGAGWKSGNMTKTKFTYHGRYIYSATFSISYGGLDALQLQLYQGSTWKYECNPIKSYTTSDKWNNKLWADESANSWISYTKDRIHGSWNDWSSIDFENKSVSVPLTAGQTYDFGIRYGEDSNWKVYTAKNITRSNCSNLSFDQSSGNAKIEADVTGTYTFTFTGEGGSPTVSVTYPTITYTAKAQVGSVAGGKVTLDSETESTSSVSKTVASGTTVAFKATASSGYNFKGWGTSSTATSYESTNNPYNVTISANKTLYAIFEVNCTKPTQNTVSGNATICSGNETTVTLANSQTNYKYKLYKGGSEVSSSEKSGTTGQQLTWTVSEAGTYTVTGYMSSNTSCSQQMSGSAVISTKGATITNVTPAEAHPYEIVTLTASKSATWSITGKPSGVADDEYYPVSGNTGTTFSFKGAKGTSGNYTVRASADDCNTDTTISIVNDPDNCPQ